MAILPHADGKGKPLTEMFGDDHPWTIAADFSVLVGFYADVDPGPKTLTVRFLKRADVRRFRAVTPGNSYRGFTVLPALESLDAIEAALPE